MDPTTQIILSTVRLECSNEQSKSVGTGYFYSYHFGTNTDDAYLTAIVTNNHVVHGHETLNAELRVIKAGQQINNSATTKDEKKFLLEITNLKEVVISHPDPDIDLCIILCGNILNKLDEDYNGFGVKNIFINQKWHIDESLMPVIRPIEQIIMVGYPNGLWDKANNLPIVRQGLTASHIFNKWNGKRHFVIDCACFPGSSGSPVFLYEEPFYKTKDGIKPGTRMKLIGTLCSGPIFTSSGRIIEKEIPTAYDSIPIIDLMMNLGFVIHADTLLDFKHLIFSFIEKGTAPKFTLQPV